MSSSHSLSESSSWQWQWGNHGYYLQSQLLSAFPHGFFTRQFVDYSLLGLTQLLSLEATPYHTKQIHGKRIITPSEIAQEMNQPVAGDGLCSDGNQQALWVATADCTPALIADIQTRQVAAIHAGWRGTAQLILPCAIARFLSSGSQLSHLRVALGPAISGEVYQVSEDVALQVGATLFPYQSHLSHQQLFAELETFDPPPILPDAEPGKIRLDVRRVNVLQLEQMGCHPEQITVAPHCTYQENDRFFSYRRRREKAVQWSGIVKIA